MVARDTQRMDRHGGRREGGGARRELFEAPTCWQGIRKGSTQHRYQQRHVGSTSCLAKLQHIVEDEDSKLAVVVHAHGIGELQQQEAEEEVSRRV
jgi:hypothetical protein